MVGRARELSWTRLGQPDNLTRKRRGLFLLRMETRRGRLKSRARRGFQGGVSMSSSERVPLDLARRGEGRATLGNGAVGDRAGSSASRTAVALTVAADLQAPSAARDAVVAGLDGRVADDVLGDARLLVSELVTNSVRHA